MIAMQNHFEIFGLTASYEIDKTQLQSAYVKLQQHSHPDRQVGKTDIERQQAALASAAANDALRVLNDDYLRAVHLLALQGILVQGDNANTKPDGMLLMQVMEWNEELEEARGTQASALLGALQGERAEIISTLAVELSPQSVIRLGYLEKTIKLAEQKVKRLAA